MTLAPKPKIISPLYIRETRQVDPIQSSILKKIKDQGKICLPVPNGLLFCVPDEIRYMQALSNYTNVHFSNGEKKLLCKTLKELQGLFPVQYFARIHKSYIVNIKCITGYSRSRLNHLFILENGEQLPVSRSFAKTI